MTKDQLFRKIPDDDLFFKLLNIYGIKDLNDNHPFTRNDIKTLNTMEKILSLKDRISECYVACKFRQYFNIETEKNLITILRQFLKTRNMTLVSKEKYVKGVKFLVYNMQAISVEDNEVETNNTNIDSSANSIMVTFN
jgi:hypothetical protein